MLKPLLLCIAMMMCICGMAWCALAMEVHWRQVRNDRLSAWTAGILRIFGAVALLTSLLLCLAADHASMAVLVWIMMTAAAAFCVAFMLAWRPSWLAPLISRFSA